MANSLRILTLTLEEKVYVLDVDQLEQFYGTEISEGDISDNIQSSLEKWFSHANEHGKYYTYFLNFNNRGSSLNQYFVTDINSKQVLVPHDANEFAELREICEQQSDMEPLDLYRLINAKYKINYDLTDTLSVTQPDLCEFMEQIIKDRNLEILRRFEESDLHESMVNEMHPKAINCQKNLTGITKRHISNAYHHTCEHYLDSPSGFWSLLDLDDNDNVTGWSLFDTVDRELFYGYLQENCVHVLTEYILQMVSEVDLPEGIQILRPESLVDYDNGILIGNGFVILYSEEKQLLAHMLYFSMQDVGRLTPYAAGKLLEIDEDVIKRVYTDNEFDTYGADQADADANIDYNNKWVVFCEWYKKKTGEELPGPGPNDPIGYRMMNT